MTNMSACLLAVPAIEVIVSLIDDNFAEYFPYDNIIDYLQIEGKTVYLGNYLYYNGRSCT
jgi:hypothetical protein